MLGIFCLYSICDYVVAIVMGGQIYRCAFPFSLIQIIIMNHSKHELYERIDIVWSYQQLSLYSVSHFVLLTIEAYATSQNLDHTHYIYDFWVCMTSFDTYFFVMDLVYLQNVHCVKLRTSALIISWGHVGFRFTVHGVSLVILSLELHHVMLLASKVLSVLITFIMIRLIVDSDIYFQLGWLLLCKYQLRIIADDHYQHCLNDRAKGVLYLIRYQNDDLQNSSDP